MGVNDKLNELQGELSKVSAGSSEAAQALGLVHSSVQGINTAILSGNNGFSAITKSMSGAAQASALISEGFGKVIKNLPIGKVLAAPFDLMANTGKELSSVITNISDIYTAGIATADSMTTVHRHLDSAIFDVGARFGASFKEVQKFRRGLQETAVQVNSSDYGYTTMGQLTGALDGLVNAGLNISHMNDQMMVAGQSWDLLTLSVQQAGAMGITTSAYFDLLGESVLLQGKTVEEGVLQLAMFKDVAEDVGLPVDKIAKSLNSAVSGFTRLGMTADLSRPLLTGFANTMKDMGLGVENSLRLTQDLTGAFGALAENYGLAYVTAQRGGLDFGSGGGVLGAGIDMQARMLEAEKTGDQGALGLELASGMAETLKSFTGGQLVTVQEASKNSALESQFYIQSQLLQDQYGLDSQTAARTIDMLSQLEDANKSGNENLAASLADDISQQTTRQDKTLDETVKLGRLAAGQLTQLSIHTETLGGIFRAVAGQGTQLAADKISTVVEGDENIDVGDNAATIGKIEDENLDEMFNGFKDAGEKHAKSIINDIGAAKDISSAVKGTEVSSGEVIHRHIIELSMNAEKMFSKLDEIISNQNSVHGEVGRK